MSNFIILCMPAACCRTLEMPDHNRDGGCGACDVQVGMSDSAQQQRCTPKQQAQPGRRRSLRRIEQGRQPQRNPTQDSSSSSIRGRPQPQGHAIRDINSSSRRSQCRTASLWPRLQHAPGLGRLTQRQQAASTRAWRQRVRQEVPRRSCTSATSSNNTCNSLNNSNSNKISNSSSKCINRAQHSTTSVTFR